MRLHLLTILLCFSLTVLAQNLVPNCSFLLTKAEFESYLDDWLLPTVGSMDLFTTSASSYYYANPSSNAYGHQGNQQPSALYKF